MKIRKWFRILHRDIGYIAVGLTVVYAISGIAVNHVADWNPNYVIEKTTASFDPASLDRNDIQTFVNTILVQLNENGKLKNFFRPDSNTIQIFVEGNTLLVDLSRKEVTQEKVTSRTIIRETNFLHLNAPKKIWTYVADLFAVALAFLAISGLFMIKGKNGIKGRGAWLTALGFLIPLIFWLLYF